MTETYELGFRPGHGKWRTVGSGLTLKEAVALMDTVGDRKQEFWFHRETADGRGSEVPVLPGTDQVAEAPEVPPVVAD